MDGWEGMEVAKTASLYFPSPAGVLGGPYVVQPGFGELGGQEPWTSGDKVGDGRNIGRTEAAGVPNGKISWGRRGSPWARVAVPPSSSCSWILEKKELRLWGWGWGEEWVYCQT